MARNLEDALCNAFGGNSICSGSYYCYGSSRTSSAKKYMEIPIKEDIFELPVFALPGFVNLTQDRKDLSVDAIVVMLHSLGYEPRYKSLDRYMRDLINQDFAYSKLVECKVKQATNTVLYYCTQGAIFDKYFKPVLMLSWQMERAWVNEETSKYKFIRPIIRIDPTCYICQEDSMQRWAIKKAATTAFSSHIIPPQSLSNNTFDRVSNLETKDLKVEICNSPFEIRAASHPSISTTNEDLLNLAAEYIDEIAYDNS